MMNVLLIGGGGREHALAAALLRSDRLGRLSVSPGNPGTAPYNVELPVDDHDAVASWCAEHAIDLVVVGPEAPLVAGIADRLAAASIPCFGPSAAAARLEGSKAFAREFAERFGIPSPLARRFTSSAEATEWVRSVDFDVVVKADGLAAGKGVVIPESVDEAVEAIGDMLDHATMGAAGSAIVVEQRMTGEELSLFGISDGRRVLPLATAQDHKRVGEGDTGPNTGGMGAFAPVPGIDAARQAELASRFLEPVVAGMAELGTPYVGVIYAGLMLTDDGPMLVEYNCRFGDPEAEVVLPLLESDALELLVSAATGSLDEISISVAERTAATVVLCAEGYPGTPRRGIPIPDVAVGDDVTVFHAGTALDDDALVSSGGRVLAVTGTGTSLGPALDAAYGVVDQLAVDGLFARPDIGWRHLSPAR